MCNIKNLIAIISILLCGCNNSNKEILKLVEECDSLEELNNVQSTRLSDYKLMMDVFRTTLDSIAIQENMIFVSNGEEPITKEDVKFNLMRFEALLKKRGERIKELEQQLSKDTNALALINHLNKQIDIKNSQISQLKSELEKKNVNIAQLQELVHSQRLTIDTQKATITELNKRTQRQGEALARQDAILNNGYVLIGSKNDLKRKNIITRRGKLVSDEILDRTKFAKIDIRNWREVSFTAKRPKILTNVPSSSYELTTSGDKNFTLTIKNPSDFWRISNYLVIQTD